MTKWNKVSREQFVQNILSMMDKCIVFTDSEESILEEVEENFYVAKYLDYFGSNILLLGGNFNNVSCYNVLLEDEGHSQIKENNEVYTRKFVCDYLDKEGFGEDIFMQRKVMIL